MTVRKKKIIAVSAAVGVLVIIAAVLCAVLIPKSNSAEENNQAPYVYLNGYIYSNRGGSASSLPDNAERLGKVHNIGNDEPEKDLDGNVDGYIYSIDGIDTYVYFQWKDSGDDDQTRYLIMEQKSSTQN